jgi:uncharacterized caspase-like protein
MKKHIFWVLLMLSIIASDVYAQSYSQFIYRKPQKRSFFEEFLRPFFTRDPFDGSYAMIIGVGDYDNLPPLESPTRDAEKMKNFLLNTAEYDEVVVLKDADATFEVIRYFMQEYFPIRMSNGRYRFLFYFTGHGTQYRGYTKILGYLQLKDATKSLNQEVINMEQLEIWADQLVNAKHMLFLIDCCFSGLAGIEAKGEYNTSVNPLELAKENGRFLITAGAADEKAIASLKEWGGSLFTHVAISGMSGYADANHDGVVTTHELFTFIQSTVKNEAQSQGRKQTPALRDLGTGTEKGQYFFVYQALKNPSPQVTVEPSVSDMGTSPVLTYTPTPNRGKFGINRIIMKDRYGNMIEPIDDIYTIKMNQTVTITVDVVGAYQRNVGVAWSAGHGHVQATDERTNTYTPAKIGGDYLIIDIWDKETGEDPPEFPINIDVIP